MQITGCWDRALSSGSWEVKPLAGPRGPQEAKDTDQDKYLSLIFSPPSQVRGHQGRSGQIPFSFSSHCGSLSLPLPPQDVPSLTGYTLFHSTGALGVSVPEIWAAVTSQPLLSQDNLSLAPEVSC